MLRRSTVTSGLLWLALLGVAAAPSGLGCKGTDATGNTPDVEAAPALPVEVEPVARVRLQPEATAIGHLLPWRAVVVQAEVGGRVTDLHAREGDTVAAGAPLATLDATLLEAQRRVAKTAVAQARVAIRQARRERKRVRPLGETGALPAAQVDAAEDAYDQARASLQAAQAQVALVERRLEDTTVSAPFAGVVTEKHAEVGALVGPGVPLYTLQDLQRLKVVASFPPDSLTGIGMGDPAHVSVSSVGLRGLEGTVHRIADTADPKSRRVPVEVALPRSSEALRPGLAAEVALPTGASQEQILVPRAAVVERFEAPYAFVVEDGVARLRRLRLGEAHGARVAVREGLSVGEALVVEGQERLSDGAAVVVSADSAPPARPLDDTASGNR